MSKYYTMKAIVLAGGYATRLWPITRERPKMLLPVGNETVIDTILSDLETEDRISEVFISTNQRFADDFRDFLAESQFEKPTLSVEQTAAEDEKLGVIGSLVRLIDREGIDENVVIVAGDNLIGFHLSKFVDFFDWKPGPALAAYDVESKEKASSYGLVDVDGDVVTSFQEKPDDPNSTLVSIACYGFTSDTLNRLPEYLERGYNPDEPGWFLQWLHDRTTISAFTFDNAWFDIGTPEGYLDALGWVLDGDAIVAESASIENTDIGNTVHVMANAELTDSSLERAVVFPETTIEDSTIRSTIVDHSARLVGSSLTDTMISAYSQI